MESKDLDRASNLDVRPVEKAFSRSAWAQTTSLSANRTLPFRPAYDKHVRGKNVRTDVCSPLHSGMVVLSHAVSQSQGSHDQGNYEGAKVIQSNRRSIVYVKRSVLGRRTWQHAAFS